MRRWLAILFPVLQLLLLALLQWGYWGAEQLRVVRCSLPAEALPGAGPLRIALITDVHNRIDLLEQAVELTAREQPDLIIFGGDFVYIVERFSRTRAAILHLRRLAGIAPTYAIYGNQDYEMQPAFERVFAAAGIPILRNQGLDWRCPNGSTLRIVGLGDWNEGDERPDACLPPGGNAAPRPPLLLLSHDPESRHLLRDYGWDLMLCGHTHGGQIANPFTGRGISFRSDMPEGHYRFDGGRHIYVSRGVGASFRMRFFCPPEINIIDIAGA
ncbi:MAG: metallophosphoesterase [Akkermansia sp.]